MRRFALALAPALAGLALTGAACAPAPSIEPTSFTGYPTPAKVGLPDGWRPTSTHNGNLNVTTPGAVLDGIEVTGSVNVCAEGVTIRNSRVHGRIWNQFDLGTCSGGAGHQYAMTIRDSTVGEPNGSAAGVTQHGTIGPGRYTALRNEVYGSDGFRVSAPHQGGPNDVLIQDNYFKATPSGDLHLDGVQGFYGGQNVAVRHNTIDAEGPSNNAAVFFADCSVSAVVENNLLKGGAYTLRIHDDSGNAATSSFNCGGSADVGPWRITGNRIVSGSADFGPAYTVNTQCGAASMTWADNRTVSIDAGYNVTSTGAEVRC